MTSYHGSDELQELSPVVVVETEKPVEGFILDSRPQSVAKHENLKYDAKDKREKHNIAVRKYRAKESAELEEMLK